MSASKPKIKFDDAYEEGTTEEQGRRKKAKTETLQPLFDSDLPSSEQKDTPQQQQTADVSLVQQRDLLAALQQCKTEYNAVAQQLANCRSSKDTVEGELQQCVNTKGQMEPYQNFLFDVMPWVPSIGSTTNKIRLLLGKEAKGADLQSDADAVLAELALDRDASRKGGTDYAAFVTVRMQKLLREHFFLDEDRKDTQEYQRKKAYRAVFGILSGSPAVLTNIVSAVENLERSIRSLAVQAREIAQSYIEKMQSYGDTDDVKLLLANLGNASTVLNDRTRWLEHPANVETVIDMIQKLLASINDVIAKQQAAQTASSKQISENLKQIQNITNELKVAANSNSDCQQALLALQNQLNDCTTKLRAATAVPIPQVKTEPFFVKKETKAKKEENEDMPQLEANPRRVLLDLAKLPWFPFDDDDELKKIEDVTGVSTTTQGFGEELQTSARFVRGERQDPKAFRKLKEENEQLRKEIASLKWKPTKVKAEPKPRRLTPMKLTKKEPKREEEPASKALVVYEPSSSRDVKDVQPQSRALVSVPRQLGAAMLDADECNEKLQAAEREIEELTTALELCQTKFHALEEKFRASGMTITNLNDELKAKTRVIVTARLLAEAKEVELGNARLGEQTAQSKADANAAQREEIERKYNTLRDRIEAVEAGVSLEDLAVQARAGATCEEKLQRALAEIDKLEKDLGDLPDEKDFKDLQDKFSIAIEQRNDAKADINRLKGELKQCTEELTKCRKELEDCNEAKEHAEQRRGNTDRLYGNSITKRQELQRMVAFMDSFIQNLTKRADDTDTKRLEERTELQIAEAKAALGEFKLEEVMRRVQRLVIQLRACEEEQVRLVELLRRANWERDEAKQAEAGAKNLRIASQRQSREQILMDTNKKLNKTACNFIEDSLEFLIGGPTEYINTGLPQRSEKKEAAMFYIHALCAEPHWAFLVARYLGKDYTMAYPLSAQIQLVLLDENETYEPESRSGLIHRNRNGWFSSSRRAKVIKVFDAFIVDMHYHRGMRELRNIHGRPKDTMRSQDPGSFQLPDASWVLKRVRFWNNEDEKPLYSREDRMAITKEIIRAYQLFDLFDLDTSVPSVEIGWKAFMTDGDAQPDIAAFVTHLVHKRSYGDAGHELIWGTIRDNPSLLRYWRYEYPEPLVLLLPLWNYIMYVLNSNYHHGQQLEKRINQIGGSRDLLTRIQTYLPKVREVHEQSVERMAQQRRKRQQGS